MEQNLPIIAKKLWKIVKFVYFMLRKGIAKGTLLADLSTMIKRDKIAGKAAMHNLMFHHYHDGAAVNRRSDDPQVTYPIPLDEYEFSCSNTPTFHLPFHLNKRKRLQAPPLPNDGDLMAAAVEMVNSVAASPALPGFGRTPMVRQLRITDSPFPLGFNVEDDCHVDAAAEKFIMKFYKDLKRQSLMAS
ncbi:hypothetical protein BUALT_Bualt07G0150300 [Buddleja alternifolia]|uniref:Avr9/Cf-9 rapidly elicited protein 146 n=1 Tax=Buddleja alternifolia TaxID=168488 RepID=A0AAV6XHF2_9LAMI|nr:hypothetical protein BUALT_Bualt07G0150300 [Buddleja alternifolia]